MRMKSICNPVITALLCIPLGSLHDDRIGQFVPPEPYDEIITLQ